MAHAAEEQSAVTNEIHQSIAEIKHIGETTQQEAVNVNGCVSTFQLTVTEP